MTYRDRLAIVLDERTNHWKTPDRVRDAAASLQGLSGLT